MSLKARIVFDVENVRCFNCGERPRWRQAVMTTAGDPLVASEIKYQLRMWCDRLPGCAAGGYSYFDPVRIEPLPDQKEEQ